VTSFSVSIGKDFRWGVAYGSGREEDFESLQLHENLRLAVLVDDLVSNGRVFACSECSTCFPSAENLRYLPRQNNPMSNFLLLCLFLLFFYHPDDPYSHHVNKKCIPKKRRGVKTHFQVSGQLVFSFVVLHILFF